MLFAYLKNMSTFAASKQRQLYESDIYTYSPVHYYYSSGKLDGSERCA
jgi:hypothetical protein